MPVTLDSLKKSVGKKNANSMVFAWLADLERESGNLDGALQRVDGGLTLYPNDIAARLVRSKILMQQEAYDPCVQECEKILSMDPFNLAAQRIMGDAFDKLGNEAERNRCYRRLHDMDPLNTFWKEEYDVVLDVPAESMGVALDAGLSLTDSTSDMNLNLTESESAESQDMSFDSFTEPESESLAENPKEDDAANDFAAISEDTPQDDPFASLAAMLPNGESADDSTMEDLSASLESAMESITTDALTEPAAEEFGAEENISGSDVGSALSDMFGLEDDLEAEESSENVSPFSAAPAATEIPASIDDSALSNAESVFGKPVEDKPQSIDDAFGDIFGEDELPEEKPQNVEPVESVPAEESASIESTPVESAPADIEPPLEDGGLFEKSAEVDTPAEEKPAEDKPLSIDDAFGDIFGEDELPEEKPQNDELAVEAAPQEDSLELPAEEGGLFEKSADLDMGLTLDEPPMADSGLFEKSAEEKLASEEPLSIDEPSESLAEEPSLEEPASLDAPESLEEPVALDEPASIEEEPLSLEEEKLSFDEPASLEEPVLEEPAVEEPVIQAPAPAADNAFSVDNAFDSLFGSEDDLPEENPAEETAETLDVSEENVSLADQVSQAEEELELPETKPESSDLAQEMGGAFASMFGDADDDLDLPEVSTQAVVEEQPVAEETPVEAASEKIEDDSLSKDLDNSFDSLFGKEDDLALPSEETHESVSAPEPVQAAAAEPTQDLDSLESEVSGAFKGLFDMDDDSLAEETKPSNKGVDFLMSGDSDDEISAGLINNPDAPLDRGAADLDESLNTRTLAEIYFDQGLYAKALDIYKDLAQKEPENEEIAKRLVEVEKLYNEKFGGEA